MKLRVGPPVAPLRSLLTPEGVPISLRVAFRGDRMAAFLVDFLLLGLATTVVVLVAVAAEGFDAGWGQAFALLAAFVIRNFYFVFFEYRWQGSTPGKRRLGLRVVDRRGGPLRPSAIFARNLTRDIELFLPLTALIVPHMFWPGAPGWMAFLASGWIVLFALMPLFNRDHLRVGDLIAGTMVVEMPKVSLLEDLGRAPAPEYLFTPAQLDVYGVHELQVLEDVLRRGDPAAMAVVAEKIARKTRWEGPPPAEPQRFLEQFYAAQRAFLEQKLLFGKRRERKEGT